MLAYPNSVFKQAIHGINNPMVESPFPQEIINQINGYNQPACDITWDVSMPGNYQFHFQGNIITNQYDFKLMAAQAITKGLAFGTNMKRLADRGLIVPRRLENHYSLMSPLDNLVHGKLWRLNTRSGQFIERNVTLIPVGPLSEIFNQFVDLGICEQDYEFGSLSALDNAQLRNYGIELNSALNGRIDLRFPDGTAVPLQHTNDGYMFDINQSPDYLMTNLEFRGTTLDDVLEEFHFLFGPLTLEVLEAVGYATPRRPQTTEF